MCERVWSAIYEYTNERNCLVVVVVVVIAVVCAVVKPDLHVLRLIIA